MAREDAKKNEESRSGLPEPPHRMEPLPMQAHPLAGSSRTPRGRAYCPRRRSLGVIPNCWAIVCRFWFFEPQCRAATLNAATQLCRLPGAAHSFYAHAPKNGRPASVRLT